MHYDADTTLPIASNIPGVTVRPWSVSRSWLKREVDPSIHRSRYVTIGRLLTISWPTYRYIPHGTNLFCCQVTTIIILLRVVSKYDYIIARTKSQLGWLNLPHFTNTTAANNCQSSMTAVKVDEQKTVSVHSNLIFSKMHSFTRNT